MADYSSRFRRLEGRNPCARGRTDTDSAAPAELPMRYFPRSLATWFRSGKRVPSPRTRLGVERLEDRIVPVGGFSPSQIRHAYAFDQITFSGGAVRGDGS